MSRFDEQQHARRTKLQALKAAGVDPYPVSSARTHAVADALAGFMKLSKSKKALTLTGRLRALRIHGGATFAVLEDGSGKLQLLLRRDDLGAKQYALWTENLDLGDIVEATGTLMTTKAGQKTLQVTTLRMLTKALRTLPEEHFGLADTEERLRRRYVDLALHPELRELFVKKAAFWSHVRTVLLAAQFQEVETPILEAVPGGAEAEPFRTHYNALDRDCTLRISLELPLKKLLVGGFEKVFEIGRIFRNEGQSPEHLQDYTQMECYWAYADYRDMMALIERLYRELARVVTGSTKVTSRGMTVDWGKPWKRYDYCALFTKATKLDAEKATEVQLRTLVKKWKLSIEKGAGRARLIDALYKHAVRPKLQEPGFLLNPPVAIEPLAKRDPKHPGRVERFQVMAYGTELGKGFSELNDPDDQRARFAEQDAMRKKGDAMAQMTDSDFLDALEYGMPPAAGFGMSERFFAYLVDKPIRETVLFPLLRDAHA